MLGSPLLGATPPPQVLAAYNTVRTRGSLVVSLGHHLALQEISLRRSQMDCGGFETTAGQVTDVLTRLGVSKERMITVMIEPDDWLTKARQESRRLVIAAGLCDDDIDRLIKQAQREVEPRVE